VRLFVAINIPDAVRQVINDAAAELRARPYPVKWVAPELLHLTVKFLGEVDPARLDDLGAALLEVGRAAKPFVLPIRGAGVFPTPRNPRVFWVGCEPVPALELIQDDVERRMQGLGFALDRRPFRPHLTIGRVKRQASRSAFRSLDGLLQAVDLEAAPFVDSLELMESRLSPGGPSYQPRIVAPLGANRGVE
jgi:RNA 2',3'-cyclic 3'-phosphodiesterase